MAQIFKFPHRDEWSDIDKLVAKKMRQEGFNAESIQTICQRLREYREKYFNTGFDFHLPMCGLPPEAIEKVNEALLKQLQDQIWPLTNAILIERISTEIALLALEHAGYVRTCVKCGGKAIVVDRRVPHKGDPDLFWDASNRQSMCVHCHSAKTDREDGGFGNPVR